MTVADAEYKFLYVDVGAEGSASDGGTWKNCTLHDAVEENRAGLHWHALARSVPQCSRRVCVVFTHGSRKWHEQGTKFMRAKFLNILKFSRRHGTHPRTLHALLTLVYDNFTPCHDSLRAIAGTKIVQVSVGLILRVVLTYRTCMIRCIFEIGFSIIQIVVNVSTFTT